jgi:hypothetical protein
MNSNKFVQHFSAFMSLADSHFNTFGVAHQAFANFGAKAEAFRVLI